MQVIQVQLSDELLRRLDERARETGGMNRADYIRELIEEDVERQSSLDDILRPFRKQVEASGMTDAELTSLFDDAREEAFEERQAVKQRKE